MPSIAMRLLTQVFRKCAGEKWERLVQPIVDVQMLVVEFLMHMRHPKAR